MRKRGNEIERHGMAFELLHGEVTRIAPTGLQEALAQTVFKTGDSDLDRLLETAREKFLNKSLDVRKEALEKLWDWSSSAFGGTHSQAKRSLSSHTRSQSGLRCRPHSWGARRRHLGGFPSSETPTRSPSAPAGALRSLIILLVLLHYLYLP
jgi:hypothetical protein